MPRCFFALWPDTATRAQIAAAAALLPHDGRPVQAGNLHITLAFLGTLGAECLSALQQDAAELAGVACLLKLDQAGWWQRPRVLWLGPEACPQVLTVLAARLVALAEQHAIELDKRPYQPHLTVARKVSVYRGPERITPIYWDIRDFCLVQSNTRKQGVEYEVISRWPLLPGYEQGT
jgi:2'-5' RNA ligase